MGYGFTVGTPAGSSKVGIYKDGAAVRGIAVMQVPPHTHSIGLRHNAGRVITIGMPRQARGRGRGIGIGRAGRPHARAGIPGTAPEL